MQPSILLIAVFERVRELKLWTGFLENCSKNFHNKINTDLLRNLRAQLNEMLEILKKINPTNISVAGLSPHDVALNRQQEDRAQERLNLLKNSTGIAQSCLRLSEIDGVKNQPKSNERESQYRLFVDAEHIARIHLRFLLRRLMNLLQKQQQSLLLRL